MPRPKVLIAEKLPEMQTRWLAERCDVSEGEPTAEALAGVQGMVVRTYTKVTPAVLASAAALKVVGRAGVGLESVDLPACRAAGVRVVYTPEANTQAVVELALGMMLRLVRPWAQFETAISPDDFKQRRATQVGRQLNELTVGILGMGRIGRRLGRTLAHGLGCRVIYNDLQDVSRFVDFPATAVDKPTLFAEADVLTLHVDMRPGNEHLVNARTLSTMRRHAVIINTCRGEVLDAHAVASALRENRLAGVAVDVYDPEPPGDDFPLLGKGNVILTPHMAARTHTAMANMAWVVRDVWAVLDGREPTHPAV